VFTRTFLGIFFLAVAALAQQNQQPQVRVNVLNVCTPSDEEKQEIASALGRVPKQPLFSQDFEVGRGRSTLGENPAFLQAGLAATTTSQGSMAEWVRVRREFSVQALFSTAQYSFSTDGKTMTEVLVLRVRDPKDLLLLSIEDSASAVTTPSAMLAASTPVTHIKLERMGKSSVVLARCAGTEGNPPPDQSKYDSLFQSGSAVMNSYRGLLGARTIVPAELARIHSQETQFGKPPAKAK
jgi:hypothetical protein